MVHHEYKWPYLFSPRSFFCKNLKFKKPATMNFLNLKINYCKRLDKNKNNEQYIHLSISQTNKCYLGLGWVIAFVNTISVISWLSVLLVEETRVCRENHRPISSHWQTWSHNVLSTYFDWAGFQLTTLVVIGTNFTGSCESNYHTFTTGPYL